MTSHYLEQIDWVKEVRSIIEVDHLHVETWLGAEIDKRIST